MKLSVTTYPWGKLKTEDDFRDVLSSIRDIGFEGVGLEFSLIPEMLKREPTRVSKIMKDVGLENGGTYSPGSKREITWAKASHTPLLWVSIKSRTRSTALKQLKSFTDASQKNHVIAALHNELRSSFQTQDQIETALDSIRNLKLCIDTAHALGANVDSLTIIEKYSNRLALVHLKDLRQKLPRSKIRFRRDFVNVGKGIVDLKSVVEKLKEVNYSGQLMLEIEALAGRDPLNAVREGFYVIRDLTK